MKTVVFDFDGTIADTLDASVEIINSFVHEYGHKKLTKQDVERLRGKTAMALIGEFKIPLIKLPFIIGRVKSELNQKIADIEIFKGMKEVLNGLKNKGCRLGILTSNSEENVRKFLKAKNLEIFDFVYSASNLFGKGIVMKRLLKEKKLAKEDIIYVGDEVRDIEAARASGVKIISVTWGFNSKEILEKYEPEAIVDRPAEILTAIKRLSGAAGI
jgi:phosphoglycolate phosphatase